MEFLLRDTGGPRAGEERSDVMVHLLVEEKEC